MNKSEYTVRYTRGSGPGGQHKNKVETCVVLTHTETGLQERCQDTRSRERNLNLAISGLKKKVMAHYNDIQAKDKYKAHRERIDQAKTIRTYNFKTMQAINHRSKRKADLKRVLDGDINLINC